jgi:molybdopterin synthase sulfur carrier subunit
MLKSFDKLMLQTQFRSLAMKINFYATLRSIVGGKSLYMPEVIGMTVQQLVDELMRRFPALHKEIYAPDGSLYPHIHFFINGRDVQFLEEGLNYIVREVDTINIFPAVGGGQE